jgi:hypothetical protein
MIEQAPLIEVHVPLQLEQRKSEAAEAYLASLMKTIADLDGLIQRVLKTLPPSKPWQRQLRQQLSQAEVQVEILRLTIILDRDHGEILQAAELTRRTLRLSNGHLNKGRADGETRAAVEVSEQLSSVICSFLTP